MGIVGKFRRLIGNWNELGRISQKLDEVTAGIDNQSKMVNEKFEALIDGMRYLAERINHLAELQRAQLILQREEIDAIDELGVAMTRRPAGGPAASDVATRDGDHR